MRDDLALLRAARADYYLVPATATADVQRYSAAVDDAGSGGGAHIHGLRIALPEGAVQIAEQTLTVGRNIGCDITIDSPNVGVPANQNMQTLLRPAGHSKQNVVRVMKYKQSSTRWAAERLTRAPVGAIYEWLTRQ
jgi:hypothetical protein